MCRLSAISLMSFGALGLADEPTTNVVFADKFESKLADGWSWAKENPQAWRIENHALMIKTAPGTVWDKSAPNMLWRSAGKTPDDTTWIAEVSVAHKPETEYEQAGLICSVDDANFFTLNIERYHNGAASFPAGGSKASSATLATPKTTTKPCGCGSRKKANQSSSNGGKATSGKRLRNSISPPPAN